MRHEKIPTDPPRHFEPGIKQADHSQERSPATAAGLYVCRRFRLDPALADLVAALAGFPDRRPA
jgi:hypothetical protein